jgi:DNA-binding NtrC family response regulator
MTEPGEPVGEDALSEHIQEVALNGAAPGALRRRTEDVEREEIQNAIQRSGGNKTHAAEALGITYRGLLKKMKRLGM